NVLAKVPKGSADMVAAAMRTIYAQPDAAHVHGQFDEIVTMLNRQFPDAAKILDNARDDVLAFAAFPEAHWRKIWSTNPLAPLNPDTQTFTRAGSYTTRGDTAPSSTRFASSTISSTKPTKPTRPEPTSPRVQNARPERSRTTSAGSADPHIGCSEAASR